MEEIQSGWTGIDTDGCEHYFVMEGGAGRSLCERYGISGLYVLTVSPWSNPACPDCLEVINSVSDQAQDAPAGD